jgi:hypothetical protein
VDEEVTVLETLAGRRLLVVEDPEPVAGPPRRAG